jgi:2-amino-4-hydroxy-6-hydroxymethyldihydropteridine diphosphokinase
VARAYIGLGANLGPKEVTILRAVEMLGAEEDIDVLELSRLRETEPVGVVDQPAFLNGAVALKTTLSPWELLEIMLRIEQELGRVRDDERWGPRTIDLDLLVYGGEIVDEPGLRVPHPRLRERRFALEPLAELDPDLDIPGLGKVSDLLAAME